jgi:hypothetical protein
MLSIVVREIAGPCQSGRREAFQFAALKPKCWINPLLLGFDNGG